MTKISLNATKLDRWEGILLNVAVELRKIREKLLREGVAEVEVEATMAEKHIEYLATWAPREEGNARVRIEEIARDVAASREDHKKISKKKT